jgi:pilus assembly protein CpaF
MDRQAVHALVASAIDAVVHLGRDVTGRRVVAGIHVLSRSRDGLVSTVPALSRRGHRFEHGPGLPALASRLDDGVDQ